MKPIELLRDRREEILAAWMATCAAGCPRDSLIGLSFRSAAESVLDALAGGAPDKAEEPLEWIMKIRALETPAEGARFLHDLKDIVRRIGVPAGDLAAFESQLDRLATAAEEMFRRNRRKISELARRTA